MFTQMQLEIINGLMLGDGSIYHRKRDKNAQLNVSRVQSDIEYQYWTAEIFKEYCGKNPVRQYNYIDKRHSVKYYASSFKSRTHKNFSDLHNIWYSNKTKIVPLNLFLTPLTVAVWLADDGSINNNVITFSTLGFTKSEVELLQLKFYKLNIKINIYADNHKNRKKEENYCLRTTSFEESRKLAQLIIDLVPLKRKRQQLEKFLIPKPIITCKYCKQKFEKKGSYSRPAVNPRYLCPHCTRFFTLGTKIIARRSDSKQ